MTALSFALLALVLASSCETGKVVPGLRPVDPGKLVIDQLETRLLRASTVHVVAELESNGAVNSALRAELFLGEGQRARLDVKGTFESRDVSASFLCDGSAMQARTTGKPPTPPAPCAPEVRDALVIGLTRMGLLHNAAMLVGGSVPDHADGNVHNWVRIERWQTLDARSITFEVVVRTDVMGNATLTLGPTAVPSERRQLIHFEEGDMNVNERYPTFDVDVPLDPTVFSSSPPPAAP